MGLWYLHISGWPQTYRPVLVLNPNAPRSGAHRRYIPLKKPGNFGQREDAGFQDNPLAGSQGLGRPVTLCRLFPCVMDGVCKASISGDRNSRQRCPTILRVPFIGIASCPAIYPGTDFKHRTVRSVHGYVPV